MKKIFFLLLILLPAANIVHAQKWQHGRLQVTRDGHYLQYHDGTPFFWLGDTGWELFHRLKKDEIIRYLDNRKEKGFNVIQAVALAELDGVLKANQYGQVPLINNDPSTPNDNYFELIDFTVQEAMKRQLFIGLLPTWGDKVLKLWGAGPVLFNETNAYAYGKWIGNRYKEYPNIIWILGGDRPAFTDTADKRSVWRAMAKGIEEGAGKGAIITYHPAGESSSAAFWPDEKWLTLHMFQSGHARKNIPSWEWVKRERGIVPVKPVLDGEPDYEDHPINWNKENGYFRDYDVRNQCYRSVFAGACGVTYGNQAMWQFYSKDVAPIAFPERTWQETLDRPGAFQVGYLKKLIESRSPLTRVPDQGIVRRQKDDPAAYAVAFRDVSGDYCMVYLPVSEQLELNLSFMTATDIRIWWFDPSLGHAGEPMTVKKENFMVMGPPAGEKKKDWVLIIENAAKKFTEPGK